MLKSREEIRLFIKLLFGSSEIIINGVKASNDDLVRLCEKISCGGENIKSQKQYKTGKSITRIEVTTF